MEPIREYSAESSERGILTSALGVVRYPSVMWQYRGLIRNLFQRDLFGRFRGSFLGIFWVLIHPLFLFAVYFLVFGYLFGSMRTGGDGPDPLFAVYLFAGLVTWTSFVEATTRSCSTVLENGNLVQKVAFPSELLPVHLVMVSLIVSSVGSLVLLLAGLYFEALHLSLDLLLWPLLILIQFVFTLGCSLFLANLQVFMRDTSHIYGIASMAWFFATPILWPVWLVRDKLPGVADALMAWNPMYPLVQAHRQVFGLGYETMRQSSEGPKLESIVPEPLWHNIGMASLWALLFITLGYGCFVSRRHKYADLV